MKSILLIHSFFICLLSWTEGRRAPSKQKRQILGDFIGARTTLTPYIDLDPEGGAWLIADELKLTAAPSFDPFDPDATAPTTPKTTPAPAAAQGGAGAAAGAKAGGGAGGGPPEATTVLGYLLNSPYPYVPDMPDIPWFGSKFNGPWGFPIGTYQGFRGSGQYINHYNYYPMSYFGSAMIPYRYRVGKR